ncbi:DUF4252 domain-containing protein [Lutibacter sp. TH_r2]|uniref:DUF4252 domain-containing protein n=1 Tax=Lutibacter sp. TH_r2 TaxID=3082083 RepID=UPI0029531CEB|nr:DUF4252 domain-containing protein [Lutibacter sp. TH_r2]MDV7185831.1 DUF4252 domain-containing protein [Lutibacter sp. TH_r2]
MKKIYLLIFIVSFTFVNCGPTHTYQKFYNTHKNDIGSTAFQMPRFMKNVLSGLSPEVNSFFNNMTDFSFITLNNIDPTKFQILNEEINLIGNTSYYSDIYRKTEENKRIVVIGKEVEGIVKELVYFNYKNNSIHSFYLKGNFDSNKVKQFSEKEEFENFTQKLLLQQPQLIPNTIQ